MTTITKRRCRDCRKPADIVNRGRCPDCHRTWRDAFRVLCRHCELKPAYKRGLCYACHRMPDVLALFPSRVDLGYALVDPSRLPAEPTDAPPGSKAKLDVLIARARAGERLHHPLDRTYWTVLDLEIHELLIAPGESNLATGQFEPDQKERKPYVPRTKADVRRTA